MIGQTISHYTILEKLGQGGMGVVYKAQDTTLDRVVAVKFLPPHLAESAADKARFVQEAKAAAALNHPNVCSIYEISEHDGRMFIVMEFVDGETLRAKRGMLSLKQASDIGIQVADGLAAAHEKGIVHRDIKPENIMVRKDGIAQIMDFGLAKLRNASSQVNRLTKEGSTVGTAGYMSPEQVQGHDVDHRSDIFSFGVVLYEMFTGELPFKGVHETALAYEIVNVDPAPMSSVKPEIDPALDAIVLDCLEKDVKERCQSVAEVGRDLRRIRRESTRARASRVTAARPAIKVSRADAPAVSPERSRTSMLGYGLALLIAVAGIAAWILKPSSPSSAGAALNPMRLSINLPEAFPLANTQAEVAISRDGKMLCYVGATASGVSQLFLHRLDQTTFEPIAGTDAAVSPAFSPDGRWIAFNNVAGKICKISIAGGVPEELSPAQIQTRGITWPTDDTLYAGSIGAGIFRVAAAGGDLVPATVIDTAAGELSHRFPQILPGGTAILYTVKPSNITSFNEALIAVERLGSGKRKILIRGATYARYVPSGQLLFVRGGAIYAQPFDVEALEVRGAPVVVAQGGWMFDGSGEASIALSDDGMLIYAPLVLSLSDQVKISWMDRKGTVTPLFDTTRWYATVSLSPDGQRVAVGLNAANDDIWVYQIGRNIMTRVTFGGGNNDFPIWTPDGRSVVYSAEKYGKPNLFRKPWDGSGSEERLSSSPNLQVPYSFTPDGSALSYNEGGDIWILPFDSVGKPGTPYKFLSTQADEFGGIFSPDGHWLAYNSNESGKTEVSVVAYPKREGKWQISDGGGALLAWSRSGKELFYFSGASLMAVDIATTGTFDFSVPHKLVDLPATIAPKDISLDGQKFLSLTAKGALLTCGRLDVITNWLETVKDKLDKQ